MTLCILTVLAGTAASLYLVRSGIMAPSFKTPEKKTGFFTPRFEEQLMYFLVAKLSIFEGEFQILDAVNLNMQAFTGQDYVLLTLRAPDGTICQVAARRNGTDGAWEFDEKTFQVIGLAAYEPAVESDYEQLQSLTAGLEENRFYSLLESDFLQLPDNAVGFLSNGQTELVEFEGVAAPARLGIHITEKIGFSSQMSAEQGANSLWQRDYPSFVGPGYRSYLYQKVKGGKK